MKLNIGCGLKIRAPYKSGWVNVDLHTGDVMASACALPFRNGTFARIDAVHVLEHISRPLHDQFYQEMYRVLKPGGVLMLEVPDLHYICGKLFYIAETEDISLPGIKERIRCLTLSLYGKQHHKGDFHCWGFYPHVVRDDFLRNGFACERITNREDFISRHHVMEPVLLFKGTK
jgi:SAM-dependent methyltransferase